MKRDHWLTVVAVAGGALIWALIAAASGRNEAWDSGAYFSIGIPAVCLLSFVLGFAAPERSWQWGVWPMVGQLGWAVLSEGGGNLLPLGVVLFGVLSIPGIVAARLGAALARRRQAPGR
jgi:hypothetical protein